MRPNERRDSGQDDLSRPWLDQLVDMDPVLAKFGPAVDGHRGHPRSSKARAEEQKTALGEGAVDALPLLIESSRKNVRPCITSLGRVLHPRFDALRRYRQTSSARANRIQAFGRTFVP